MNRTVAAVVLNYNNPAYTLVAVQAVLAQRPVPSPVIVVDNGSRPNVVAELRSSLPQPVELVALPGNAGIPGALNEGLRVALDSTWASLIVLNDTQLEPGALARLVNRLDDDDGLAAVAPLQVRFDDPDTVVSGGNRLWPGLWLVSRLWQGLSRTSAQAEDRPPPRLDFVDFTCVLLRNRALREVGLPDDSFRFYWEDAEWCMRARRAGWSLMLDPKAVVRHRISGTLGAQTNVTARYYQYRNRLLACERCVGRRAALVLVGMEPVLLLGRLLVRGSDGGGTRAQARAARDFLLRRPYPPL